MTAGGTDAVGVSRRTEDVRPTWAPPVRASGKLRPVARSRWAPRHAVAVDGQVGEGNRRLVAVGTGDAFGGDAEGLHLRLDRGGDGPGAAGDQDVLDAQVGDGGRGGGGQGTHLGQELGEVLAVHDPAGGECVGEAGARREDRGSAAAVGAHPVGVGEGDLRGGLVPVHPGDAVDGEARSSAASPPPRRSSDALAAEQVDRARPRAPGGRRGWRRGPTCWSTGGRARCRGRRGSWRPGRRRSWWRRRRGRRRRRLTLVKVSRAIAAAVAKRSAAARRSMVNAGWYPRAEIVLATSLRSWGRRS